MKKDKIVKELEIVRNKNDGVLQAAAVVAYAKNPKTALHAQFEWDDTAAAREYRLWQARELIRVVVEILPHTEKTTRVYVSMMEDRKDDGGGYRTLEDVMKNPVQRQALLVQAKAEADSWAQKYQLLEELAPVFEALDRVFKRHKTG